MSFGVGGRAHPRVLDGVAELGARLPLDVFAEAHEEELLEPPRLRNDPIHIVAHRRALHLLRTHTMRQRIFSLFIFQKRK